MPLDATTPEMPGVPVGDPADEAEEFVRELENIIKVELEQSNEFSQSFINNQRATAMEYYYGLAPLFKERRSSYISMDVFNAIENSKAIMSEVFASNKMVCHFDAMHPQDEVAALLATHLVNKTFYKKHPGYELLDSMFHDGLLSKICIAKSWWQESEEIQEENFQQLPEQQFLALGQDPSIIGITNVQHQEVIQNVQDPRTGQPMQVPMRVFSGTLRRSIDTSHVEISIPRPENFFCSADANSVQTAVICGEWSGMTASEMKELGFSDSDIKGAEAVDTYSVNYVNIARHSNDSTYGFLGSGSQGLSTTRYRVYEIYVRTGDKIYQCYWSNTRLVSWDEVDRVPYRTWSPFPLSHRWIGQSLADVSIPIQKTKSLMMRSIIELQQQSLFGRSVVNASLIKNPAELTLGAPGSIIQTLDIDRAIKQMPVPALDPNIFTTLESFDKELENRSGVSRVSTGQSSKMLEGNAPSGSLIDTLSSAGMRRSEKMCRSFAESLLKPLLVDIYMLCVENQDTPEVINVGGQYQQVVPSQMEPRKIESMSVTVALTPNEQSDGAASLLQMHQIQIQDPDGKKLYGDKQKFHLLGQVYRMMGHEFVDAFLNNPNSQAYQQMQQSAAQQVQKQQAEAQQDKQFAFGLEQEKVKIDMFEAETDRLKTTGGIMTDQTKAQVESMYRGAKARQDNERVALDAARVGLESERVDIDEDRLRFDIAKAEAEYQMEKQTNRPTKIG